MNGTSGSLDTSTPDRPPRRSAGCPDLREAGDQCADAREDQDGVAHCAENHHRADVLAADACRRTNAFCAPMATISLNPVSRPVPPTAPHALTVGRRCRCRQTKESEYTLDFFHELEHLWALSAVIDEGTFETGRALLLEAEARESLGAETSALTSTPVAVNADSLATWFLPVLEDAAGWADTTLDLHIEDQDHSTRLLRQWDVLGAVTSDPSPVDGCRQCSRERCGMSPPRLPGCGSVLPWQDRKSVV